MDRGRNLEALAEEDDEEEMEDEHRRNSDSDDSTSDDDSPDEGTKRGEPNKFDILCDGVNNAMALVHTAMEEFLDMKDEMLKHQLPPTLLIKLATNTGKVFRSISDLNMPVNELVRLVRVYSTPWEEKSAALKKLHEDYEAKQRQLNIAIKRLQLVDAHSKRIAREKRVMNWEKLFAKVMSNKGHGRRWKFLIETIKQKAKLGLEHVQEFTRQLDESDESDDDDDDDMPPLQLKHGGESPTSASDKASEADTEGEDDVPLGVEAGSESGGSEKALPSIKIDETGDAEPETSDIEEKEGEDGELDMSDTKTSESAKRVRFAADDSRVSPQKVETKDAEVWTNAPEFDHFLFFRMYSPVSMDQADIKCSIAFGKQYYKTKRLDDSAADKEKEPAELALSEIKKKRYEEAKFSLPPTIPDGIWVKDKDKMEQTPKNCQITIHSGPTETIAAMATIDLADLKELDLKVVDLSAEAGDDDVPKTPEPPRDDDLDSLSSDIDILLPGDEKKPADTAKDDQVKDVDPMMFPLYSLDGSSAKHSPCGQLPLVIYWARKEKPHTFNRQTGTHGVTELVFELTGIDLETTSKADLHKETKDESTSVISFTPDRQDRAISAIRFTPEAEPPNPPTTPEPEPIEEEIITDIKEEEPKVETPIEEEIKEKPETPSSKPKTPDEEMIARVEYDKLVDKHNTDVQYLQEEYEKEVQKLVEKLQKLEDNQKSHEQLIMEQQAELKEQQKQLSRPRPRFGTDSPGHMSPRTTPVNSAHAARRNQEVPSEVNRPVIHAPMPPGKPRTKNQKKRQPVQKTADGIPSQFLERLAYFEDESYRHKLELIERTRKEIQEDIEKKLAGQHKLSRQDKEVYEALNDVSLPALFMPFQRGSIFNPRAHQYFHPNGSTDLRLTQPPSVFQLPPLNRNSSSVLNLFELSKNFTNQNQGWLMDRYIQQQEPVKNVLGVVPQSSMPTSQIRSPPCTPHAFDMPSTLGEKQPSLPLRTLEAEAEC